jgi:hypothetical protein
MGPSQPRSSVLTEAEEAIVVAFRQRTLLPQGDVLGCLRETIPRLSRSALHRCCAAACQLCCVSLRGIGPKPDGISRLPQGEEQASRRKRFTETKIGYVHIDVCELR